MKRKKQTVDEDEVKNGFQAGFRKKVSSDLYAEDAIMEQEKKIFDLQQKMIDIENVPPETIWYQELEEFGAYYAKKEKLPRSSFETCPLPTEDELNGSIKAKKNDGPVEIISATIGPNGEIYNVVSNKRVYQEEIFVETNTLEINEEQSEWALDPETYPNEDTLYD